MFLSSSPFTSSGEAKSCHIGTSKAVAILGCILLFGKSYLQKKGENTADKEDSQKIANAQKNGENIANQTGYSRYYE